MDFDHPDIPVCRQCELLGLARSSLYYQPMGDNGQDDYLMRLIDEQFTVTPFYGSRRMTVWLKSQGYIVNRKKVCRLMNRMGIQAVYPKKRLSRPEAGAKTYPYLLKDLVIDRPDQVWAADITYVRMKPGFVYLMAIIDWFSRYVVSWGLSITMEADFCVEALNRALGNGRPEIFNTDQGSQFTSARFIEVLETVGIAISMDGRGRVFDNIFVERLWRSVKYEEVYLREYATVREARVSIGNYFRFYNFSRFHQTLGYKTPYQVYTNIGIRNRKPEHIHSVERRTFPP